MERTFLTETGKQIYLPHIQEITAISEIFPEGKDIAAVVVRYNKALECRELPTAGFWVKDRRIRQIYSNNMCRRTSSPIKGEYMILELEHLRGSPASVESLLVKQEISFSVGDDVILPAWPEAVQCTRQQCQVLTDFQYKEHKTGAGTLKYQLFIPRIYMEERRYPLVLFLPDLENRYEEASQVLTQGQGGVVWTKEEQQSQQECFVVVPVIGPGKLKKNGEMIIDLLGELSVRYKLDMGRLYLTAQSEGCALAAEVMRQKPELFCASFLAAPKQSTDDVEVLARKKLCMVLFKEDACAARFMETFARWAEENGISVQKLILETDSSGKSGSIKTPETVSNTADGLIVVLTPSGTEEKQQLHRKTWEIAYTLSILREWLFMQKAKLEERVI